MPLSIRSGKVEQLARELSRYTGKNITDSIGDVIEVRLSELTRHSYSVRAELAMIAAESAGAPDLDTREQDAILGYDRFGTFEYGN